MTNEEKALEAARVIKEEIGLSEHSISRVAEIIDWCLTWKGHQFKEYLEKKLNKNYQDLNYYIDYKQPSELFQNRIDIIEEIINDLFKED